MYICEIKFKINSYMESPITGRHMQLVTSIKSIKYRGKVVNYVASYYACRDTMEEFTTTELDENNLKSIHHSWMSDRIPRREKNKTEKILRDELNKYKSWYQQETQTKLGRIPNYIKQVILESKILAIKEIQNKLKQL